MMRRVIAAMAIAGTLVLGGWGPAHAVYGEPDPQACWYYRQWAMRSYAEERRSLELIHNHPRRGQRLVATLEARLDRLRDEGVEYELGSLSCRDLVAPPDPPQSTGGRVKSPEKKQP
jgi:hypothetical protein